LHKVAEPDVRFRHGVDDARPRGDARELELERSPRREERARLREQLVRQLCAWCERVEQRHVKRNSQSDSLDRVVAPHLVEAARAVEEDDERRAQG
jgi:hypothetical protein